ncbi:MAG TPA: dockerin type I domain-containing protein, partial [Phycisphaerae bacterium]|nr:dockerin type I domain-containing protein [Phycisphaerae bacterium]
WLGRSGQHTVVFGEQLQVVATWTQSDDPFPEGTYSTLLPPNYWESTVSSWPCYQPGDVNGDCHVNGLDIQWFIELLLADDQKCRPLIAISAADLDSDGDVDVDDIPPFVGALLTAGSREVDWLQDCNRNGIPDVNDIANASSQDCDHNFIPDECDIGACDPNDPNQVWCRDVNSNGVPDGCEPDCNKNGIPDAWDIANCDPNDPNQVWCRDINSNDIPDGCEVDCNKNGIPDSWEIAQNLVDDCNANGVPDECERDCNDNGIPDACDIANQTSEDCNGNLVPDECDLLFAPPRGSLDCNDNGIPDECDIANCGDPNDPNELWCQDCNGNGVPDACDIAANVSLDENENGIPDECEGGQRGWLGGEFEDPAEVMEAWAEYFDWLARQQWLAGSELSGSERFGLMAKKMQQLGLPARSWTMPVRRTGGQ